MRALALYQILILKKKQQFAFYLKAFRSFSCRCCFFIFFFLLHRCFVYIKISCWKCCFCRRALCRLRTSIVWKLRLVVRFLCQCRHLRKRREFLPLHIFSLHPRPSYQKNCSRDIKFNCFNFWCFLASLLGMIADGKMEGEPKRSKGTNYRWILAQNRQIYSFHLGQNRTLTIFKVRTVAGIIHKICTHH